MMSEPARMPEKTRATEATGYRPQLQFLYRGHHWFDLRDAVQKLALQGFYRGAVACAFNEFPECLDCLLPLIKSAPTSQATYHAHDLLTWTYMRRGHFSSALRHVEAMLRIKPEEKSARAARDLLSLLRRSPDQSIQRLSASVLRYDMVEGSLFIPAAVNGRFTNFMVDSGATISMITQSEASRLGLRVHEVGPNATKLYGATGCEIGFHVTVAARLDVGKCRLSNVTFLVLKDEHFQFPSGYAGALGLPVLIGLQTISWNRNGELHAAFRAHPRDVGKANIVFDGPEPVVDAAFRDQKIPMVLDTGNSMTVFGPEFAMRFADLVSTSGRKSGLVLNGVSGSAEMDSACLSKVALHLGGFEAILRPAHVLLKTTTPNSNWLCGRLGIDFLNRAARVALDFNCMKLTLEHDES